MEAVIFEVVTKAGMTLAVIVGFIAWRAMGSPWFTITRGK
jgi:uncharacterized membrane protein